jgi:light-regulated signal transduction histidine kinase (bacteriophytochrome)
MSNPESRESGLCDDVERLARRNAELERSNIELEWSVFAASHDLQECLRTVTVYAEFLERRYGASLKGDAALFISNIVGGATRMRELLADLLVYTKSKDHSSGPTEIVDLNVVLAKVKLYLKLLIEETDAAITSAPLPAIKAHASDFIHLFHNLLLNAINYRSKRPPEILISTACYDGWIWFAVSDNGIGIDSHFHEEVFAPFKRLQGGNIPGTGIGLAICRRMVERYAGRIWVESRLGAGASFCFTLPDQLIAATNS